MSLEVQAKLICDGCGAERLSYVEHRSTYANGVVWEVRREAEQNGWRTISRGQYHTPTHYCPACADKPMKPVPRKPVDNPFTETDTFTTDP
jgi:hypothetical protein